MYIKPTLDSNGNISVNAIDKIFNPGEIKILAID